MPRVFTLTSKAPLHIDYSVDIFMLAQALRANQRAIQGKLPSLIWGEKVSNPWYQSTIDDLPGIS